jgi:3-hydroxyisobutyrate dehydrogenase-like beta-hydroxyacid dehydrogenase
MMEAEPMMRRSLEILLNIARSTGHPHPMLRAAVNNYTQLLTAMGRSREEVVARLNELGPDFQFR